VCECAAGPVLPETGERDDDEAGSFGRPLRAARPNNIVAAVTITTVRSTRFRDEEPVRSKDRFSMPGRRYPMAHRRVAGTASRFAQRRYLWRIR
jgi:hypothetical protein